MQHTSLIFVNFPPLWFLSSYYVILLALQFSYFGFGYLLSVIFQYKNAQLAGNYFCLHTETEKKSCIFNSATAKIFMKFHIFGRTQFKMEQKIFFWRIVTDDISVLSTNMTSHINFVISATFKKSAAPLIFCAAQSFHRNFDSTLIFSYLFIFYL